MIVFGPALSPYVRKVLAFGAEKGLELDHRPGQRGAPDPEFTAASPFRKVPAFKDGDFHLADSSAIVAYMDRAKAEPALIPSDPKSMARTIWFDEFADTILGDTAVALFFNRLLAKRFGREPDHAAADRAEQKLPEIFGYLEGTIPASGYLVDDRLTLADIAVASFFPNLDYLDIRPDPKAYPKTAAYVEAILARPSFAPLVQGDRQFLAAA
jgi:glutathione S-transferase